MKAMWFTWETQRRNRELASAFGATLKQFDNSRLSSFMRYLLSAKQTIVALREKPKLVFCQCPSLVLCILLVFLKFKYNFVLVIDAHNAIIKYLYGHGRIVSFVTKFVLKNCDFLILSNKGLFSLIPCEDQKKLSLPDKLPNIQSVLDKPKAFSNSDPNIVFISSFADDEPIYDFLRAAKNLSSKARFFITGKKKKASDLVLSFESKNIIFTDYILEKDFDAYITHADLTVDLTTLDDLLVCGAYETLAVGVPGILSDTKIQRETFKKGYVFTKCDPVSLEEALEEALLNREKLKKEIIEYREDFVRKWGEDFAHCREKIERLLMQE